MIRTAEFSIAPSATATLLARRWLVRRWLFFALPVGVALLAAGVEWRFALVALMMVFVAWPMALSFVWFGEALDPAAVRASQPHVVSFDERGIGVEYAEREGYVTPPPELTGWGDILATEHDSMRVCYTCRDGRCIVVPSALLEPHQWQQVEAWRRRI